ncbi:hypothetical protein [Allosphingosinicella vermicomposti]|uniref:hypothetical protein n=1 Tax=Allosphingosinicella vermicomposti TaxID=614671 RepID=UPI000D113D9C|nr:hypothetical protein [Allosphingosinicella vermicomposti]
MLTAMSVMWLEGKMLELKIGKPDGAMDWLTFVSSLVGSVAWPIAVFAIALLFRVQIRQLINRIKKLSMGDNSVDFGEKLDEAEAEVVTVIPEGAAPAPTALPLPNQRTQQLIALSPAAAVLDSWRVIERKTLKMAEPFYTAGSPNRDGKRVITFRGAVKTLFEIGMITSSTYTLLLDLQQLRNAAAHYDDVSRADAIRFTTLAEEVLRFLDGSDVMPDKPDV